MCSIPVSLGWFFLLKIRVFRQVIYIYSLCKGHLPISWFVSASFLLSLFVTLFLYKHQPWLKSKTCGKCSVPNCGLVSCPTTVNCLREHEFGSVPKGRLPLVDAEPVYLQLPWASEHCTNLNYNSTFLLKSYYLYIIKKSVCCGFFW